MGFNPTSVSMEMKNWSKEVEDIDMVCERVDGFIYGAREKNVKSYASFMVESDEKRYGNRVNEVCL